ncbi:2237_t:CDS:2, partial [Gigaspora margarita]
MLLSIRWCKDEITEFEHAQEPFLIASCNTKLAPAHGHVKKKLRFTKTMSLAKQAITLQEDNENDYELEVFLKNYIEKKLELDPAYHVGKGALYKNRIKGEQEKYQEKKKSISKPR